MKDRIVTQAPTQEQIDKLVGQVNGLEKQIEAFTVSLTPAERAARSKMRVGGEKVIAAVGQLVEEHGVVLPQISLEAMRADLERAQALRPLAAAAQRLARRLEDTVTTGESQSWSAATAFYTALSRMGSLVPGLQDALRPIVSFFALGPRKKTPAGGTPSVSSAA
jgi:hypothetical protein